VCSTQPPSLLLLLLLLLLLMLQHALSPKQANKAQQQQGSPAKALPIPGSKCNRYSIRG
jgi:hypothetical protein